MSKKREQKLTLSQLKSLAEKSSLVEKEKIGVDAMSDAYALFLQDNGLEDVQNIAHIRVALKQFNNSFIKDYCPPIHYIGEGSERFVYACDGRTCFKLDLDAYCYQNKLEAKVLNNAQKFGLMCFPELVACSEDMRVLEVECCAEATRQKFREIVGADLIACMQTLDVVLMHDGKYDEIHFKPGPMADLLKRMEGRTDMQACVLDDIVNYQMQFAQFDDIDHIDNWGIAIRDGQEVVLPIDVGM